MDLIDPIRSALAEQRYNTPTPIQGLAIPSAIEGRDILGSAQTGTGKTAAFSLPILHQLGKKSRKARPKQPFALILAPTRELAIQIDDSLRTYGKHLHLRRALVYGGASQHHQVRAMQRGAHILIATPGRLLDLMNQGFIDLSQLETFVLDEADRMLDMGFLPDLKRIIKSLPKKRQSLFFSATLPPKIVELSNSLLNDPVRVSVTPEVKSVDAINQQVVYVEKKGKQNALRAILGSEGVGRTIVFTRTKRGANQLAERLDYTGIKSTAIHGNKSQNARQKALEAFRKGQVRVLVATDVAARGIDVAGVTHVINYDIPEEPESYIHRIGRTGRAGKEGVALSFCSKGERRELKAIERLIGKQIPVAAEQPRIEREADGNKGRQRRDAPPTRESRPTKYKDSSKPSKFKERQDGKRRFKRPEVEARGGKPAKFKSKDDSPRRFKRDDNAAHIAEPTELNENEGGKGKSRFQRQEGPARGSKPSKYKRKNDNKNRFKRKQVAPHTAASAKHHEAEGEQTFQRQEGPADGATPSSKGARAARRRKRKDGVQFEARPKKFRKAGAPKKQFRRKSGVADGTVNTSEVETEQSKKPKRKKKQRPGRAERLKAKRQALAAAAEPVTSS